MTAKRQKILYISGFSIIVLTTLLYVLMNTESNRNVPTNTNQEITLQGVDELTAALEDELQNELKVLKKENDQTKVINSDQAVMNEFNTIFPDDKE